MFYFSFDKNLCVYESIGCHNKSTFVFPFVLSKSIFILNSCRDEPFFFSSFHFPTEWLDHLFYYEANNSHIGFVNSVEWQPNHFHWRQMEKNFFSSSSSFSISFYFGHRYSTHNLIAFFLLSNKQQAISFEIFFARWFHNKLVFAV